MLPNLEPTTDELERENESGKAPPDRDSEVQSQVNKDGRIQQKDCAQQQVKRKLPSADGTYRNEKFKSVGLQPECMPEKDTRVISTSEGK